MTKVNKNGIKIINNELNSLFSNEDAAKETTFVASVISTKVDIKKAKKEIAKMRSLRNTREQAAAAAAFKKNNTAAAAALFKRLAGLSSANLEEVSSHGEECFFEKQYVGIDLSQHIGQSIGSIDPYFVKTVDYIESDDIINRELVRKHEDFKNKLRAKKNARNLGLPPYLWHWLLDDRLSIDAINCIKELDKDMNYEFLSNRKNFDSHGVWGINAAFIWAAWKVSKMGQAPGYFKNIIKAMLVLLKKNGRLDNNIKYMTKYLPKKYLKTKEILKIWETLISTNFSIGVSAKVMKRISSLSYLRRELAIAQLNGNDELKGKIVECDERDKENYPYHKKRGAIAGMKHINWERLSQPEHVLIKDKYIDAAHQWFWYLGKLGLKTIISPKTLRILGNPFIFNKKQISFLLKNGEDDLHQLIGLINALKLFGNNFQAISKLRKTVNFGSVLTDSKSIESLSPELLKEISSLILRDQRFIEMISNYQAIREELGCIPRSFESASKVAQAFKYDRVISAEVAIKAADAGLSQDIFEKIQSQHLKNVERSTKLKNQSTSLPMNLSIDSSEGYHVYLLPKEDPRGLFLGKITNCCQTISDAGEDCAISGSRDGDKGFLIIEKNNKIIAQSWVWVDDEKNLVLDSIESKGLSKVQLDNIAQAISKWKDEAINTIFIDRVFIGKTSYGCTKSIRKRLQINSKNYKNKPQNYSGYMDGNIQRQI